MKKLILLLSVFSLALAGCETNDDSSGFNSRVKVDGVAFSPAANGGTAPIVSTAVVEGANGVDDMRFFKLTRNASDGNPEQQIQVYIYYPANQSSANGTYVFELGEGNLDMNNGGAYVEGNIAYDFTSGKMIVSQMSNNKFKLKFVDVHAQSTGTEEKLVTGEFSGQFEIEQIYILN